MQNPEVRTRCLRSNVRYGRELHGLGGVEHQYLIQVVQSQISAGKEVLEGTVFARSRGSTCALAPQRGYGTACPINLEGVEEDGNTIRYQAFIANWLL